MTAILKKELNAFFNHLTAYLIIGFFLTAIGAWVWYAPTTNVMDTGLASMNSFFDISPYILMILLPAVTMRSLSEEKKMGTLEILLISPLSPFKIVLGKYLASLIILGITFLFTSVYYFSLYQLGAPQGNIDSAGVITSYVGLYLLGASFAAIGLFSSSVTKNQLIAFLLGVMGCVFFFQFFDTWSTLKTWKSYSLFIAQWGGLYHYTALSNGVVDARDVVYFLSTIFLMLALTVESIRK